MPVILNSPLIIRCYATVAACGSVVMFAGGQVSNTPTQSYAVDIYNVDTHGVWTHTVSNISESALYKTATCWGKQFFVLTYSGVSVYDVDTKVWHATLSNDTSK